MAKQKLKQHFYQAYSMFS